VKIYGSLRNPVPKPLGAAHLKSVPTPRPSHFPETQTNKAESSFKEPSTVH